MKADSLQIDPYATHLPALTAMLALTKGNVLELGCGNYSTPVLHEICRMMGRMLISVESDSDWLSNFIKFRTDGHRFVFTDNIPDYRTGIFFGLVFVDNDPYEQRKIDIEQLRDKTDYFVVHDTEPAVEPIYYMAEILKTFRYRRDYTILTPHTTVVSDTNPLKLDIFE